MQRIHEFTRALFLAEDGPTAVEYGVLLGLIVATCALVIAALGESVEAIFSDLSARF